MTDSLKTLTGILKDRFGRANMTDKYRIEVRNRRRKPSETLRSLHSDIRRLIDHYHRESIACNYFIDALADPDFALKLRERAPEKLDNALRIALQIEVWTKGIEKTELCTGTKTCQESRERLDGSTAKKN